MTTRTYRVQGAGRFAALRWAAKAPYRRAADDDMFASAVTPEGGGPTAFMILHKPRTCGCARTPRGPRRLSGGVPRRHSHRHVAPVARWFAETSPMFGSPRILRISGDTASVRVRREAERGGARRSSRLRSAQPDVLFGESVTGTP
jgi:hypothetical protein